MVSAQHHLAVEDSFQAVAACKQSALQERLSSTLSDLTVELLTRHLAHRCTRVHRYCTKINISKLRLIVQNIAHHLEGAACRGKELAACKACDRVEEAFQASWAEGEERNVEYMC